MSYNTKNYTEQGGEVTHIGGKLKFDNGAVVEGLPSAALPTASATAKGGVKVGAGLNVAADGTLSVNATTFRPHVFVNIGGVYGILEREYESGMTWQQFIDSAYNIGSDPSRFSVKDGVVTYLDGGYTLEDPISTPEALTPSQKILPCIYTVISVGP